MLKTSSLLFGFALFALAGCAPGSIEESDELADDEQDELRDGVIADNEHPEAGLLTTEKSYCTGTLIGRRTVLTAAHCFKFKSKVVADTEAPLGKFTMALSNGTVYSVPYHRQRADAWIIQVGFDIGVAQLDWDVPSDLVTPAELATEWPEDGDTLTVYGYGRFGEDCDQKDAGPKHKRKAIVEIPYGFYEPVTCPGDSGGPYFWTGTNQIVAVVKGDGLGAEWVGNAVKHRDWIIEQLEASEKGELQAD
ncbi:MAG: trypsin-like serine protease [Polyangiaceae bacterium]|nr:trypsin-like serine protease [Polyangiaceae bacterium]